MKVQLQYYDVLESTNITAVEAALNGAPEGSVIVAKKQCRASGRMQRAWNSPEGGLWFSVILRPRINPEFVAQLTLLAGVSVVKAISKLYNTDKARIKWPNDLLFDGKKICGILSEMKLDEHGMVDYAILGIGVNVNLHDEDFPEALKNTATSLKIACGMDISCDVVLQHILDELSLLYEEWLLDGPDKMLDEWKAYSCTLGSRVLVKDDDKIIFEGLAADINPQGALMVRNTEGIQRSFDFGEISIR